ncbi:MAG: hypothetical protein AVDCRST_MAG87-767, partial [uncultured Thermomicrobiales bacterium]
GGEMPQRSSGHHHSERSGHGLSCFSGILGQAPADARRLQSARTSTTVEDRLPGVPDRVGVRPPLPPVM